MPNNVQFFLRLHWDHLQQLQSLLPLQNIQTVQNSEFPSKHKSPRKKVRANSDLDSAPQPAELKPKYNRQRSNTDSFSENSKSLTPQGSLPKLSNKSTPWGDKSGCSQAEFSNIQQEQQGTKWKLQYWKSNKTSDTPSFQEILEEEKEAAEIEEALILIAQMESRQTAQPQTAATTHRESHRGRRPRRYRRGY
jgi:hypothetical protein